MIIKQNISQYPILLRYVPFLAQLSPHLLPLTSLGTIAVTTPTDKSWQVQTVNDSIASSSGHQSMLERLNHVSSQKLVKTAE